MKTIKYSNARQTLRKVIDDCVNNDEPVLIKSKANDVVVIPKKQYDLMSSALNDINSDYFGLDLKIINEDKS